MAVLAHDRLADLLEPYFPEPSPLLLNQLSIYLDLLLKWNARTNLTAIREPEAIVTRHFGESLFTARHVPVTARTLLDLGSGAGFPGLPIQLVRPELRVTLAESQHKKGAFLREAIRTLGLDTSVWSNRSEELPFSARFDVVALRAVDRPELALQEAHARLAENGTILHLGGACDGQAIRMPCSQNSWLQLLA